MYFVVGMSIERPFENVFLLCVRGKIKTVKTLKKETKKISVIKDQWKDIEWAKKMGLSMVTMVCYSDDDYLNPQNQNRSTIWSMYIYLRI